MTIEEKIEEERALLPAEGLIPVTLASFQEWKLRKAEKKQKDLEDRMKEESKKVGSKGSNILSGRALFKYDPNLFQDDDEAAGMDVYEERNEEEEEDEKQDERKVHHGEDGEEGKEGDESDNEGNVGDKDLFQE